MPQSPSDILIVGTRGHLLAFNKNTGAPAWKYEFEKSLLANGSDYVTTLIDGDELFAGCYGAIYCFDVMKGKLLWTDNLRGKGYGVVSFAAVGGATSPFPAAEVDKAQFDEAQPG
jgi:outer membrane protein assembly factor BamB